MSDEEPYILGTHDDEVVRLGLQHRVWRWAVEAVWRKAGFGEGQTLLDVGCGPGYATLDLAAIVGPAGRVVAVDQSRRFLNVLEANAGQRGLRNISTHELDLDSAALPELQVDGAWCRWIFAFLNNPRALLERVAGSQARWQNRDLRVFRLCHLARRSALCGAGRVCGAGNGQLAGEWRRARYRTAVAVLAQRAGF